MGIQCPFVFLLTFSSTLSAMAGPMRTDELSTVKPPRPPNSWILYRAYALKRLPPPGPGEPRRSQSEVSALVSRMWRQESEETKAHFERMAEEAKAQHKIQFPNYRYQPKKKEEKERLRELQKKQRESERLAKKTRRVGQRTGSPAPSTSRSFFMPGAPYFNPHMLYNSVGPSPPLSASSSPSDVISSPPAALLSVPEVSKSKESISILDVEEAIKSIPSLLVMPPVTLPTALDTPTNVSNDSSSRSPSSFLDHSSHLVESTGTSDAIWQFENQALLPEELNPSIENADGNWDSTVFDAALQRSPPPTSLLFSLSQDQVSWLRDNPQTHGNVPSQGDTIYPLDNFDPAILALDPHGEVEVSLGSLPPFHDHNLFEALFPPHNDYLSSNFSLDSDPNLYSISNSSNDLTNLFFDFNESSYPTAEAPTTQPVSESPAPQQQIATSSTYTPPSGAAYSSTRRVGGNWASLIYTREELLPQSPPVQAN